jgi:hypothetical protein
MEWHSTRVDKLPLDKQMVLISVDGVNYIAVFDSIRKIFGVDENQTTRVYRSDLNHLYWTELIAPAD